MESDMQHSPTDGDLVDVLIGSSEAPKSLSAAMGSLQCCMSGTDPCSVRQDADVLIDLSDVHGAREHILSTSDASRVANGHHDSTVARRDDKTLMDTDPISRGSAIGADAMSRLKERLQILEKENARLIALKQPDSSEKHPTFYRVVCPSRRERPIYEDQPVLQAMKREYGHRHYLALHEIDDWHHWVRRHAHLDFATILDVHCPLDENNPQPDEDDDGSSDEEGDETLSNNQDDAESTSDEATDDLCDGDVGPFVSRIVLPELEDVDKKGEASSGEVWLTSKPLKEAMISAVEAIRGLKASIGASFQREEKYLRAPYAFHHHFEQELRQFTGTLPRRQRSVHVKLLDYLATSVAGESAAARRTFEKGFVSSGNVQYLFKP
jgi:hypothetical protein